MTIQTDERRRSINIEQLNKDIEMFTQVHPITEDMHLSHKGVSRLVMLDRYAFKDTEKRTLQKGDFVVLTIKEDPKFPARGLGFVEELHYELNKATVAVHEDYVGVLDTEEERESGMIVRSLDVIEKPLEVFYEQIARRNARGLADVEKTEGEKKYWEDRFYNELSSLNFVPAGRVLYGAGADTEVTYFNCYVMPFPKIQEKVFRSTANRLWK